MLAHLRRLGRVEYEDALRMQEQLVLARQQEQVPDQVLLVSHPHIFTLGRRADAGNILIGEALRRQYGVQVFESVRGGDVTYHGPGQIVLYPILALPTARQDVVRYVRDLEEVMIRALADFGIDAGRIAGLSGTWVGNNKIGAVGVRMARWVTSHGIALNVNTDLRYFDLIVPCGIRDHGVTSMAKLLGRPVDQRQVEAALLGHLQEIFGLELELRPIDMPTIQAIAYRKKPDLELLCLHRVPSYGDFWQPVTGRIEAGEQPRDAAVREVQEETGLSGEVRDLDYVHAFALDPAAFPAPKWPVPCFGEEHGFAIEVSPDAEVQLDPTTHDAHCWLPPDEAMTRMRWPGNREGMRLVSNLSA